MARKPVCLGALLLLVVGLGGGCWTKDNSRLKAWEEWVKIPLRGEKAPSPVTSPDKGAKLEELAQEHVTIDLYFARRDGNGLEVEKRDIPKVEGIARQTMHELLTGPRNPNLKQALPAGTKLLDINLKPDGLCIVNFNDRIGEIEGRKGEVLAVYSVVNTLAQFPTVKRVDFLIEGEPVDTLAGTVDLSNPVAADYTAGR